ncbi:hypothetical protein DSO57_1010872 [Entomophthora muscae]|uniref:Uncharacterized protein n=1 Tax=Entomophthora muscae TaxID=34485 RepID=A0ACC2TU68_9FUNG|nr:hypothetical protein DSO57_1010872 [Entomophthora muscae]
MATIWRELDTSLAIGSRQCRVDASATMIKEDKEYIPRQTQPLALCPCGKRISVEVSPRHIFQTETKDISDHILTSKEEEEEDQENNEVEEGSPSTNLDQ